MGIVMSIIWGAGVAQVATSLQEGCGWYLMGVAFIVILECIVEAINDLRKAIEKKN